MKKIVFNGKKLIEENSIGVGRYTYEIIKEFDQICSDLDVEVLIPDGIGKMPEFENIEVVKYGGRGNKKKRFWEQIYFLKYILKEHAVGVNLDGGPPLLKPDITCKHDVTHLLAPDIYIGGSPKRKLVWYWHKMIDFSLKHFARVIITVSDTAKKDIVKYYKIDPRKVIVIGNAWQHLEKIGLDMNIFAKFPKIDIENYYFCLGAQNRNKNFQWVIENALKHPENQYVIAGKYVRNYGRQTDYDKNENIIFLGYVSDEELKALMSHCRAFLFPSFYEGFGIPPMEALAAGRDAVVSNCSCLPEIYEDAVYYIDPNNPDVDLNKIIAERKIAPERKSYILNKYSWKKSAVMLKQLLLEIYN